LYQYPRGDSPEIRLDRPYSVLSAYLQNELDLTRWLTVVAGLRYDRHSRSGEHLSPRLAVVISPDHNTALKLLYGSAFRAPSVAEKDYVLSGAKLSDSLGPEQIRTLEIALERQLVRGVVVTAGAFYYDMESLIDLLIDPTDSLTQFRNGAEVHAHGFELGVEGRVTSGLRGGLSWSYARARSGDGAQLTNSPQNILRGSAVVPLTSAASVAFEARYETGRRTISGASTSNFFMASSNLRWAPVGSRLEASLRVRNLFDASYDSPAGPEFAQSVIQQDGRTFLISMGARF
jgi:iron complex outermembrane receptor protein